MVLSFTLLVVVATIVFLAFVTFNVPGYPRMNWLGLALLLWFLLDHLSVFGR